MSYVIKKFTIEHFEETQELLFHLIDTQYGACDVKMREVFKRAYTKSRFQKMHDHKHEIYYIALLKNRVCGILFGNSYANTTSIAWAGTLSGHSKCLQPLLNEFIKVVKKRGVYKIEGFVPQKECALYKKHGFTESTGLEKDKFVKGFTYLTRSMRRASADETTKKIRMIGIGGQGIKLLGTIIAGVVSSMGYQVVLNLHYDSVVRGGYSACDLLVAEHPVINPVIDKADIILDLSGNLKNLIPTSQLIYDTRVESKQKFKAETIQVPMWELAHEEVGSLKSLNMVACGLILRKLGINLKPLQLLKFLPSRNTDMNMKAILAGYKVRA